MINNNIHLPELKCDCTLNNIVSKNFKYKCKTLTIGLRNNFFTKNNYQIKDS